VIASATTPSAPATHVGALMPKPILKARPPSQALSPAAKVPGLKFLVCVFSLSAMPMRFSSIDVGRTCGEDRRVLDEQSSHPMHDP
jgi:hypothetical protein